MNEIRVWFNKKKDVYGVGVDIGSYSGAEDDREAVLSDVILFDDFGNPIDFLPELGGVSVSSFEDPETNDYIYHASLWADEKTWKANHLAEKAQSLQAEADRLAALAKQAEGEE